jgi:hypothetical protein
MSKEKPNFYAVIPATVRYDETLSSSQKLFYAEITAMSQKEGFCWASNSYFSNIFGVANSTVSSWVTGLKEKGHILVEYEKTGKNIDKRLIYPIQKIEYPYSENRKPPIQKSVPPYSENPKENNTSINNTSINKGETFFEKVENSKSRDDLKRLWYSYRKKKGKHPNLYEQEVLLHEWESKSIQEIKKAILYTVKNGWFSLQYPESTEKEFNPENAKRFQNAFK